MSNLPITTSPPQTAAKPAQAAAETTTEDSAAQGQPFGDVLARQVAGKTAVEDTSQPKKIALKSADEIFAEIKGDSGNTTASASAAATDVPADMLATLLPQGMNIAVQPTAAPAGAEAASQAAGLAKRSASAATGLPAQTDLSAAIAKADPRIQTQSKAGVAQDVLVDSKKDAAFASMLTTMTNKSAHADEKSAALATAPSANAAALASMTTAAPLNPANVMPVQVSINTPVTSEKWGDEFNQKITWLAGSKEQSAELHLNPPQLGPMDVVIKVSGDQATALFTSPHAAVREAIEQALPKLREMMADSGIMLGNASVSDQAPRNSQEDSNGRSPAPRSGINSIAESSAAGNLSARVSPISRHNGIVDTFA